MKKVYCLLALALFISGCTSNQGNVDINTKIMRQTPLSSPKTLSNKDTTDRIWDNFAENSSLNEAPKEPDLYLFYIEGLKNKSDYVRWYSAYKIIEYSWDESHRTEITKLLNDLCNDKVDFVKNAATFSLAVINKEFQKDIFKRSPDGNNFIFTRFYESRYNGGEIWIYNKPNDSYWLYKKIDTGNLGEVAWAPNSRKVCISFSGRTWSNVGILDINTNSAEHALVSPEISSYIVENKKTLGYKVGQNLRPDFYINFLEWKEDSTRVLLSYSFTDDDHIDQSGIVVYNLAQCKVERLEKYNPAYNERSTIKKPLGFKW